ncbi:MAG: putative photosynthetic complex assembly protein PuhE [Paracoccaceae bacterium]
MTAEVHTLGPVIVPAAVAAALFLWWFSTGALIWLAGAALGRGAGRSLVLGAGALALGAALVGLDALGAYQGPMAVYLSFLCGLAAWGVVEVAFLTGALTGPVARPCPPDARGPRRFALALGTLLWHELALVAVGLAMIAITMGAETRTGTLAFALLMAMRVSAKLNLFLGVPYPPAELLPRPLAHLESYFRVRRPTLLLPLSVTAATAAATVIAWLAAEPGLDPTALTGYALLWTLLVLGILEHWFLILPVREAALWRWFTGHLAIEARPAARHSVRASP